MKLIALTVGKAFGYRGAAAMIGRDDETESPYIVVANTHRDLANILRRLGVRRHPEKNKHVLVINDPL